MFQHKHLAPYAYKLLLLGPGGLLLDESPDEHRKYEHGSHDPVPGEGQVAADRADCGVEEPEHDASI